VDAGKEIAKDLLDWGLFLAIDVVGQRLHANFYHGSVDLEAFRQDFGEILYGVEILQQAFATELAHKLGRKEN
jgi:hypothetical protein